MTSSQETALDGISNQSPDLNSVDTCPITSIITMISKTWTLLILKQLNNIASRKRFNELANGLGKISPRTLTTRLRELEAFGLIERRRYKELPPRVEYGLTPSGRELIDCFKYIGDWVNKWGHSIQQPLK